MKTYVVTPHLNRLDETVLIMGLNISFKGEIRKLIAKLPFYPFLSGALCSVCTNDHDSVQTARMCSLV